MKKAMLTFVIAACFSIGYAQMYNDGGTITVQNGASLVIQGDYTSTNNGDIEIDGDVALKGNFVNNSGTINSGSTGTLTFSGTSAQTIGGSASTNFHCGVTVNNPAGVSLTGADETITGPLTLSGGMLTLNTSHLTLDGTVSGADATKYLVTNNTGTVKRTVGSTGMAYPIGNSSYNPLTLANAGTSDVFGARVIDGLPSGWTSTDQHAVLRHWEVSEAVDGGSDLTVTPEWASGDQELNFDVTDCAVGLTTDDGATVAWDDSSPATGTNPYTQTGDGYTFSNSGLFMVGDYFYEGLEFDLHVLLGGPYNSGTSTMSTSLNSLGYLPLSDPYFTPSKGVVTAIPSSTIVDWIEIELRDQISSPTVTYSFAKFIDEDGTILNLDGTPMQITNVPKGSYYVAIMHRNHLGVISANPIDFASGNGNYSFLTDQSQAWQNTSLSNPAMKQISTNVFALYEGNANGNTRINATGFNTDKQAILNALGISTPGNQLFGYYTEDINMNGRVNAIGFNTDKQALLNVLGINTPGNQIIQHLP